MSSSRFERLAPAFVALGTLALAAGLVLAVGASPLAALDAIVEGSLGSRAAIGETMGRATSLILCAVGSVLAFRAGVLNIGLEGQFMLGAIAAAGLAPLLDGPPFLIRAAVLLAASLAGALWTLPSAWLAERRRVPQVLSTILLNLLAAAAVTWLVRGPLRDPMGDYPQSRPIAEVVRLSALVPGSRVSLAFPAALLIAGLTAVFLTRTSPGLALRATGESPRAARAAGLPDTAIRIASFAASGALAGLGGGLEVLALTGRLYDPFGTGVGYTGIAAALLGGTTPLGGAGAAFLFAAIGAGSSAMQREAGVPASLAGIVPAVAVLLLLALKRRSP